MPDLAQHWILIAAIVWYGAMNLAALGAFAWDKRAAVRRAQRVRERTLLGLIWLGGFVGAYAAMRLARHKTRKWVFRLAPLAAAGAHAGVWAVYIGAIG